MDIATRQKLIAQYKAGYDEVVKALEGASEAELDRRPGPGTWSARDVVHHLADSEMTSAIRLRRLLAEDAPVIVGYDEAAFARTLHYDRPIAASLEAFRWARVSTAELLDRMSDADWTRAGTHSESGTYPVTRWLELYAEHAVKHAGQIRRARQS
jgi:uncharacterized damage-inducible protein DinB